MESSTYNTDDIDLMEDKTQSCKNLQINSASAYGREVSYEKSKILVNEFEKMRQLK